MVFIYCQLQLKSLNLLFETEVAVVLDWHGVKFTIKDAILKEQSLGCFKVD